MHHQQADHPGTSIGIGTVINTQAKILPLSTLARAASTLKGQGQQASEAAQALCSYYELVEELINPETRYRSEPLLTQLKDLTPVDEITFLTAQDKSRGIEGREILKTLSEQIFDVRKWPEKVYTVRELAERYSVSDKTISRWCKDGGLQAYPFKGLSKTPRSVIGISAFHVSAFEQNRSQKKERAARFSRTTTEEQEAIITKLKETIDSHPSHSTSKVIRAVATEFLRSPETVKALFEKHKLDHYAERAREKFLYKIITPLFLKGESIGEITQRYNLQTATATRELHKGMLAHLGDIDLCYMPHSEFEDPKNQEHLLGPMPEAEKAPRRQKIPEGLPPYLRALYEYPVLTQAQEQHLFKKMNYLKYLAHQAYERLKDSKAPKPEELREAAKLREEATLVRNTILEHNLRLVVSIAKRFLNDKSTFHKLVSDGNKCLLRAVEKFDAERGFKFSTYATTAIQRNYSTLNARQYKQSSRFQTGNDQLLQSQAEGRIDELQHESQNEILKKDVTRLLDILDDRESKIIQARFGFGKYSEKQTLKEVGKIHGVTKERIRQIEARALSKLRTYIKKNPEYRRLLDLLPEQN